MLTKTEQAVLSQQIAPVRLDVLINEVTDEFGALFEDKNIRLEVGRVQKVRLIGDREALHRMLANLLQNALNYTDTGGSVSVSLSAGINSATLKIADTGIGIPEESKNKIFDRFYRVDTSRARSVGGSGLGLSIVKAIAESHHASVNVQSEIGKGTSFTITFPVFGQTTFFEKHKG